jgi:hypothetical protein
VAKIEAPNCSRDHGRGAFSGFFGNFRAFFRYPFWSFDVFELIPVRGICSSIGCRAETGSPTVNVAG